jgi:citrate lyase synthetase
MIIRVPYHSDRPEIDRIYREFFNKNEYPDFYDRKIFSCPFIVATNRDEIVVAGGVKTIAEAVVISDQSLPIKTRLDALLQALGSVINIVKEMKRNQVHVFVNNDEKYVKVLQEYGFKLIDAKLLVLDIGEPHG